MLTSTDAILKTAMPHSEPTPTAQELEGQQLPYWLINVPKSEWPESCPDYLLDLSPRDRAILTVPNDKFARASWEQVKDFVRSEDINQFRRAPIDLRKYLKFSAKLKAEYGSVSKFLVSERLRWSSLEPRGKPFEYPEDYKFLYNDWPYALDERIVHLVCWVKFELAEDPQTGRSTPEVEQEIDGFVDRTFRSRMPKDNVVWFKNYKKLKSVHDLEHFHVMLYDPPKDLLEEVTGGDVPMVEKVDL